MDFCACSPISNQELVKASTRVRHYSQSCDGIVALFMPVSLSGLVVGAEENRILAESTVAVEWHKPR